MDNLVAVLQGCSSNSRAERIAAEAALNKVRRERERMGFGSRKKKKRGGERESYLPIENADDAHPPSSLNPQPQHRWPLPPLSPTATLVPMV